jgi:serine beta-lactamase-like protein LACTB
VIKVDSPDLYFKSQTMKKIIQVFLVLIIFSARAFAQNNKDAVQLAHRMGEALLNTAHLPGLSIAVMKGGKVVYAEAFGYADMEKKIPVTTSTQFRTASVAKMLTATATGKLVQEGKLDLNADVQQYVPEFPVKEYPITIRQLAGHLSGLPHYNDLDKVENRFYSTVKDGLSVFAHEALLSKPGTVYDYSTHGFTLLSAAIEKASGMTYLDYMKNGIFKPLGMSSTGPDLRANPSKEMSSLYIFKNGLPEKESQPEDPSYKWAAGGMISTPTDLVKMAEGYFNGFLSPQTVDTLFKTQKLASGKESLVGIGWRISQDVDGRMVRDHAGSMGGARSVIAIYPKEHAAIAIMTNVEWNSMMEETAQMIILPFLSGSAELKLPPGKFDLKVSSLNGKNETSQFDGTLILKGGSGILVTAAGFKQAQTMPLIHLQGNRYALVRPDAICYMTIEMENNKLTGRAIAYGSRLNHSPLTNTAFMTFTSVN